MKMQIFEIIYNFILKFLSSSDWGDWVSWGTSLLGFLLFFLKKKVKKNIKKNIANLLLSPLFYELKLINTNLSKTLKNKNLKVGLFLFLELIEKTIKNAINEFSEKKELSEKELRKVLISFYRKLYKELDYSIIKKETKSLIISTIKTNGKGVFDQLKDVLESEIFPDNIQRLKQC
jgi:hypothetical protein